MCPGCFAPHRGQITPLGQRNLRKYCPHLYCVEKVRRTSSKDSISLSFQSTFNHLCNYDTEDAAMSQADKRSYRLWAELLSDEHRAGGDSKSLQVLMQAEMSTIQNSVDEIAKKVIDALESVIDMKSPYPQEYQEVVCEALRFGPGSSFDELLTASEVDKIVRRLKSNRTL